MYGGAWFFEVFVNRFENGKKNSLMSAMITALMFSIKSDPVVRKKGKRVRCVCVQPAAELLYDQLACAACRGKRGGGIKTLVSKINNRTSEQVSRKSVS